MPNIPENILFIDFEASSLNMVESYPIQVAYNLPNGKIVSYLINPYCVDDWDDWDLYAQQAIHGFSREQLRKQGKDPLWVANMMNEQLNGQVLYTNAPDYDGFWRDRLFNAVGMERTFRFSSAYELFYRHIQVPVSLNEIMLNMPPTQSYKEDLVQSISQRAWQKITGQQHQADVDVMHLLKMWEIIQTEGKLAEW
jgi:hypothetical protein